jgi:hypothetical protein
MKRLLLPLLLVLLGLVSVTTTAALSQKISAAEFSATDSGEIPYYFD